MILFITNHNKASLFKLIKLGKPQFAFGLFFYFCIGALLAVLFSADFVLSKFILGYVILFLATLAVHYHNDYFDFEADQYGTPTVISGGSGVLVENPQWRELSKRIAISIIGLSIAFAVIFTVIFSYTIWFLLFVIFGNLLAWFYAAPPIKLSYRGLGEFGNTAIGILFPAMGYFTLMGTLNFSFFVFVVPLMFLQLIFTNSVEIPDMEGDKLGGKITWIVSRGRAFGFKLIAFSGFMVVISFLVIPFTNLFPPNLDFRTLALFSLIPLSLGIVELIKKPWDKVSATKFATYNLIAIFVVLILINCYFIYVLMGF